MKPRRQRHSMQIIPMVDMLPTLMDNSLLQIMATHLKLDGQQWNKVLAPLGKEEGRHGLVRLSVLGSLHCCKC